MRNGSYTDSGWSSSGQRRNSIAQRNNDGTELDRVVSKNENTQFQLTQKETDASTSVAPPRDPKGIYPNGYQFPPKHTFWKSTTIFLRAFWKFTITPLGFFIVLYALNVVAWGGMLFLLLVEAAPAMCVPNCWDLYSPRQIWLEIDSQILNALFCVTGLGLIPWRFRDLYYLLRWRWQKDESALRKLAGIYRGWFRLQGSQDIPVTFNQKVDDIPAGMSESCFAYPLASSPDPPLTGERAPPTAYWKLDFFVWAFVLNTLLQFCLCGVMWGLTRFNRPSAATGLLISLGCIVAMAGGWLSFMEGKKIKKIEGVPVSEEDQEILKKMREQDAERGQTSDQSPEIAKA